ncbi:MAG: 5'/3'-nucleotidase SurE, partial [Anaerolineae bacterium]
MSRDSPPLILITNDDGIASPGLRAAIRAVRDLGQVLVVAPRGQQSGASRNFLPHPGTTRQESIEVDGGQVPAFSVEAAPAPTVRRAILTLVPRLPDLAVVGINYGENVGVGLTISGTIGAAIEAASFGIPALAMSLETEQEHHFSYSDEVDFTAAAHFTRHFARCLLSAPLPPEVDILKVDVPMDATPQTPWRLTRVSRQRYFQSIVGVDESGDRRLVGYDIQVDFDALEPDSDIYALRVDRVVSVSPLTIDLSAKVEPDRLAALLEEKK